MGKTIDIVTNKQHGSTDNLILIKAAKALKLSMDKHLPPYHLVWIKNGDAVKVSQTCLIPLSIGKTYFEKI